MSTLTRKTTAALIWSMTERVGVQAVQFIIGIILARLLSPAEFGLVGMLTIFIAVSGIFIESGFGTALVQKQDATHTDECSIFYFNIFISVIAAVILCILAPYIAAFYHESILTPLTQVLSLNLIINAFGLIQVRILTKDIDFKTQTEVSILALIISGTIGVYFAITGFGVWSLVIQSISNNFFRTAFFWAFNHWRPSWIFSFASLKGMFGYGSKLLVVSLINTIVDNIYYLVIGKFYAAAEVGFYTRARSFEQIPSTGIMAVVGRVSFPVFASIQEDQVRLKRGLKKSLTTLVCINFPIMIGLAVVAKPLVIVLITEKWLPCVPYLQVLCIVGMMYPPYSISVNVMKAVGRSDLLLRLEIIKQFLVLLNIAVTWRWGVLAMIWGHVIISFVTCYLASFSNSDIINYKLSEQIKDITPYLIISLVMGAMVWMIKLLDISSNLILLIIQCVAGFLLYIFLGRLFRLPVFNELLLMFKNNFTTISKIK
jgi:O-antigen/teichoic acid export membrane protein